MKFVRMLMSGNGRTFIQDTKETDVNCQYGLILAKDINLAKDGDVVESNSGEKFVVYSPSFVDHYKKIKRQAQIITFKDAGIILTTTGLGKESTVIEAGSGSGAMTVLFARHCEAVYSYDINHGHIETAKHNIDNLGFENVIFRQHDITTGIPDKDADCLLLDMPEPWHVLKYASSLKIGAYVVAYTPSAIQLQKVQHEALEQGLLPVRCVEVTERHWMVKKDAVRPTSRNTAFTAFLSFFRWLGPQYNSIIPSEKPRGFAPELPEKGMDIFFR